MKRIVTVEESRIILPSTGSTTSETKSNVKLPKLDLKKFDGEPTEWQSFFETFLSAVDSNDNLSNVEKFTYLKSYLEKEAARTIQGFSLTNENYCEAIKLLKERFGNKQLIISSHVNKLLKVKPISSENVKGIRLLYDNIESHVRSLN